MGLTGTRVILTAASKLPDEFTESDLIIASWKCDKDMFGLEGYENEYPAENKILSKLMGIKGLVQKGFLKRIDRKKYKLTNSGKLFVSGPATALGATALGATALSATVPNATAKVPLDNFIIRVIESDVYNKFEGSRKDDITFTDYLTVAGVPKNGQGDCQIVLDKLRLVESKLSELTRLDKEVILSNGRSYSGSDSRVIINLFDWLATRFQKHLLLIAARKKDGVGE